LATGKLALTTTEAGNLNIPGLDSHGIGNRWQLVFFVIAHLLILILLFNTVYKIQYSATGIYFDFASKVLDGNLPYRDFTFEYPPFSLLFFVLPRLLASTWLPFSIYYQAEVVIFDIIGILIVYRIASKLGNPPWAPMMVYTLGVLAMGPIICQQYDIFPAVMSLLAVYLFWSGKHKTAWAILALATLTKIYPALIAPILIIHYLRNGQWERLWQGLITFGAVCLVILLPFLITSPASLRSLYDYHALRGIQLESAYSAFLLVAEKLNLISAWTEFNHSAWNIMGTGADVMTGYSTFILGILLLAAYWFIYRQTKKGRPRIRQIGTFSMLVVLITLFASKVLSPQYIIWLIPLLPLISGGWGYIICAAFVITGGLTYLLFPWLYFDLALMENQAVAVLFIRNGLLIAMAALTMVSLASQMRGKDAE
jgi:hypothetical protein